MDKLYYMGIDVGSTTVKLYVEDQEHQCIYSKYQRHYSDVKPAIENLIKEVQKQYGNLPVKVVMTGSGGLSLSNHFEILSSYTFKKHVVQITFNQVSSQKIILY